MDHGFIGRGAEPPIEVLAPGPVSAAASARADEAARLSDLWAELVSGSCKVEETRFSSETCTVIVRRGQPGLAGRGAALSLRDIEILEQSLLGGVRKSVAVDHCLCSSSIAEVLRRCFVFMGLSCWPSRIPLLLVMAVHAKHAEQTELPARRMLAQSPRPPRQSITASRPDVELANELSRAEFAVTRLFVEGKSHAQIAEERRISPRTVANQLASAFHRLDVSGRAELFCLLSRRQVAEWQASGFGTASGRSFVSGPAPSLRLLARVAG
ncbi:MAG: LuxR C-terminal-related transcriptional regulator [Pseudomonadota bacterium]